MTMLGKLHTHETKLKMSQSAKGNKNALGAKRTIAFKMNVSERNRKRIGPLNPNYGRKLSQWHIDQLSKIHKGKTVSIETRQKLRDARSKQKTPFRNTKPEIIMQVALSLEGFKYLTHIPIKLLDNSYHQCDILIEPNLIIECDGDYWHRIPSQKKRDVLVTESLERKGFTILRFWESDIKNNINYCIKVIKGVVGFCL